MQRRSKAVREMRSELLIAFLTCASNHMTQNTNQQLVMVNKSKLSESVLRLCIKVVNTDRAHILCAAQGFDIQDLTRALLHLCACMTVCLCMCVCVCPISEPATGRQGSQHHLAAMFIDLTMHAERRYRFQRTALISEGRCINSELPLLFVGMCA